MAEVDSIDNFSKLLTGPVCACVCFGGGGGGGAVNSCSKI